MEFYDSIKAILDTNKVNIFPQNETPEFFKLKDKSLVYVDFVKGDFEMVKPDILYFFPDFDKKKSVFVPKSSMEKKKLKYNIQSTKDISQIIKDFSSVPPISLPKVDEIEPEVLMKIRSPEEEFTMKIPTSASQLFEAPPNNVGFLPTSQINPIPLSKKGNQISVINSQRTEKNDVFAAGSVAELFHPVEQQQIKLISFVDAMNQGEVAALSAMGYEAYNMKPATGFWDWFGHSVVSVGGDFDWDELWPAATWDKEKGVQKDIGFFFGNHGRFVGGFGSGQFAEALLTLREGMNKGFVLEMEKFVTKPSLYLDLIQKSMNKFQGSLCQRAMIYEGKIKQKRDFIIFLDEDYYSKTGFGENTKKSQSKKPKNFQD